MKKICLMLVIVLMVVLAGQYFHVSPLYANSTAERKEPFVAALLSLAIPGLGQVYAADWQFTGRAVMFLGVWIGAWAVYYVIGFATLGMLLLIGWVLPLGWTIYAAVDAARLSKEYNTRHGFALLENKGKELLALKTPEGKITLGSPPTQFQVVYR
ncbi:hypothetical protein ES703_63060 [subsurface metagenome]